MLRLGDYNTEVNAVPWAPRATVAFVCRTRSDFIISIRIGGGTTLIVVMVTAPANFRFSVNVLLFNV